MEISDLPFFCYMDYIIYQMAYLKKKHHGSLVYIWEQLLALSNASILSLEIYA